MPELLTPDEQAAADTYRQVNGGARQPATWGEIWDANWKRGGLDTLSGLGKIQRDEHDRFKTAIQTQLGDVPIEDYARQRGLPVTAPSFDKQVKALNDIADTLTPEQQTQINDFRDVRARASKEAAKIDDDATEVDRSTYGVSGWVVGGLAGMASQAVDPFSAVTSVLGGVTGAGRGILRQTVGGAVGNILPTLGTEPSVAEQRERLGLETSAARSLTNIAASGVVGGVIGAAPPTIAAGFRASTAPLSQRLATFGTKLRDDPLLAAKTPFDADTVDTVARAVRRDEVTGPAPGKNPIEHETMVGGAKEAANVRGSLHDDGRVVPDTDKPIAQPVMAVDRSPSEPARPAAPEAPKAAAAPEPAKPTVIKGEDYVTPDAEIDAKAVAKDVTGKVKAALERGDSVTYFVEDKPVEIVKITKGMMQDAQGQRWGTLPLLQPTPDLRTEVVITPKTAAAAAAPAEAPAARVPEDFLLLRDDISASDYAARMSELREEKPRPIEKLWNDPSKADPEKVAAAKQAIKDWQKEYNKVSANQKKALARDNAAFAARQQEVAKITVGDPVLEQQVRSTLEQRGDLTFVVDDAGTESTLSKALQDSHNDAVALSELRGCIEGNKG